MVGLSVCLSALVFLAADESEAWTPSLEAAPAVSGAVAPRDGRPELLYVNFDGAVLQSGCGNDAHFDCSTLADVFDGYVGPYGGNLTQRMSILQATRDALAPFGVRVVVDRPPDDVDYTMVLYGDLGDQGFAGIAPYIDCEDLHPGDTSFTQAFSGSNTGSTVILQEAAHTWGLEHVDSEDDILNPFKSAGQSQDFLDECLRIVANTELEPTAGVCNQIHSQFCEPGWQNSYREMELLFGPHIPDVEPPTLEITFPPDGATFVAPTTFALLGEVDDNLHPQFYNVQIFLGDQLLEEKDDIGLDQVISMPPPDEYNLRVVITDAEGNVAEDTVSFTILPEGSEQPAPVHDEDDEGEDPDADGATDGCRIAGMPSPQWGALVLVLGLMGLSRRRC